MASDQPRFILPGKCGEWYLLAKVQPGAKRSEVIGEQDGRLRIRLAAPAVDNKANEALLAFIAKLLGIRTSKISLVSGKTSRQKKIVFLSDNEPDWSLFIKKNSLIQ